MFAVFFGLSSHATSLELVSALDGSVSAPAGANGDSFLPVMTPDGRYVLFASTGSNLVLTNYNGATLLTAAHTLNVFLRDRLNGTTTFVSADSQGDGGNGDSFPAAISTNGQFALFQSTASNLVPGDTNGASDIFLRDLVNHTTTLVSLGTNNVLGNGNSRDAVMTPDAHYVAFVSSATNFFKPDKNNIPDIFVRDLWAHTTALVSAGAKSNTPMTSLMLNGSESPQITPDGRYVAFCGSATNLVPGVQTVGEIYVRDLASGTTIWASTNARTVFQSIAGTTNCICCNAAISADGQFVAFEACPTNLAGFNGAGVVMRFNVQTGVTDIVHTNANVPFVFAYESINNLDMTPDGRFIAFVANGTGSLGNTIVELWDGLAGTNGIVSVLTNGAAATGICDTPVINPTGQYVAFVSSATNLPGGLATNNSFHVYLRNMSNKVVRLIDADTNGVGAGIDSLAIPALSDDGSLVAFERTDGNMVAADNNRDRDVFVRNVAGASTELISPHDPGVTAWTPNGFSTLSLSSVSADGRFVAFVSDASDLTANGTNNFRNIYVRDLVLGTNFLVSVTTNGISATNTSLEPAISADGRFVVFSSDSPAMAPHNLSLLRNILVRDLQNETTTLVSARTNNLAGGAADSSMPVVSTNGQYVLFHSKSSRLAPGPFVTGVDNLFFRDVLLQTNYGLTFGTNNTGVIASSMTPDGHYVAYIGTLSPGDTNRLYVWDSQALAWIYTNDSTVLTNVVISANGRRIAYVTNSFLAAYDLLENTNQIVAGGSFDFRDSLQFSADGQFLVYVTISNVVVADNNRNYDVYLYDFAAATNILVSRAFDSAHSGNGRSDSAVISPDGRFIAYRSLARNIVPSDTNNAGDLFLYDRLNAATTLVSVNRKGASTANHHSSRPVFSGDSGTLVFCSYASDLSAPGFNEANAIFALKLQSPAVSDSDDDGMDDAWELAAFGTLARDGSGDYDGDGASDLFEFLTGTDPTDPQSIFTAEISGTLTYGQNPTIDWPLAVGKSYRVQYKDDLGAASWQDVDGSIIQVGNRGRVTDLTPAVGKRFYRIVLTN
ncbi:MAG TPA: hypothetical protein VN625_06500 [Desulfuromonadaceae bacterium]|nr:hypothetical protein [Desulfuromonadaceae bacterium]